MAWFIGFTVCKQDDEDAIEEMLRATAGNVCRIVVSGEEVAFGHAGRQPPELDCDRVTTLTLGLGDPIEVAATGFYQSRHFTLNVAPTLVFTIDRQHADETGWSPFLRSLWRALKSLPEPISDGPFIIFRWDLDCPVGDLREATRTGKQLALASRQMLKEGIPHCMWVLEYGRKYGQMQTLGDIDPDNAGQEFPGPTAYVALRWKTPIGEDQEIVFNDSGDMDVYADDVADLGELRG